MSKTKNYAVTIYNGKGTQKVVLRAISENAAIAEGKKYCRENKIIGGTVLSAERARL